MIFEQSPLYQFNTAHWDNFTKFSEFINDESLKNNSGIYFEGHGYFEFKNEDLTEKYYLFGINDKLFGSVLQANQTDNKMHFEGVFEFNKSVLTTKIFPKHQSLNKYKVLEAKILIDCRPYDYGKDHRLYLSQEGKVDLLFTHQLIEESNATLKVVIYPSLKSAVDWQAKVDLINAKTEQIIAERQKNKK